MRVWAKRMDRHKTHTCVMIVHKRQHVDEMDGMDKCTVHKAWVERGERGERGERAERAERGKRGKRNERGEMAERAEVQHKDHVSWVWKPYKNHVWVVEHVQLVRLLVVRGNPCVAWKWVWWKRNG